jgi:hypothetical protein
MRWTVCLFLLLLTGCQGLPRLDQWETVAPPSVMPLWERYQQCLDATEPATLLQLVEQFEQVMLTGPEPPTWMRSWNLHVMRQPLRTAVDPQALGAACTIRTALVLAERNRVSEARALYEHVVSRYPEREWTYYREQAKEALASLQNSDPAVIALGSTPLHPLLANSVTAISVRNSAGSQPINKEVR